MYKIIYSDELYHHGIKGQQWGVTNGPPYPLDASDHSASEKKAGWRKSLGAAAKVVKTIAPPNVSKGGPKTAPPPKNSKSGPDFRDSNAKTWSVIKYSNANREQKALNKESKKLEKQEHKERLKKIDPELAKNKQTKRVAMDYHILSDREFKMKYQASKSAFAKRYVKSDGDTYSMGLKKAVLASIIVANSSDISYYNFKTGRWDTIKAGKEQAVKLLAQDIGYSEAVTRLGYDKAEQKYNDYKEFQEWKANR